ncbi:hypothetical protein CBS115989_4376 [Aspergillus niger]|uniref:Starch synthase catalytic domain family protein n=2 Tax=Aspergillus niger TaxID=5061 RepID=A0A254UH59_ASPNG|nr:hypothetical protein ANI_1_1488104 [Aspergillus niger CBS 513.88]KAI2819525.1 hypothetical protein CBS115989_4376 [Aspergillus niger]RDH20688.1 hypothetical protein M747DRAFT_31507 [Aspergillus niger ATCC 13496]KAI2834346.1 hypothetical protein CBS11232_10853 [Aspergillus niger]KAI2849464.1 hypothetical protein CBS11350_2006 [Aspergillus niger]KAI2868411.1 hypothetical protein CBS115988_10717 [Aspergillus niger]|eukprot:XP_001395305.2 hypothetical protein ANI_1_1488104 [Aspergillus niger CBS 513.88]
MSTPISKGYDRLAALMARDPGSSIYRSFSKLNAKNLLYLQAEIAYIQIDLQDIIEEDGQSEDKVSFPFSVWDMKNSEDPVQWEKVLEARKLLKEYNTALLQQAQLLRLNAPEKADLEVFQAWLKEEESRNMWFSPPDQWRGENESDLVALNSRHEETDRFTRFVYTRVLSWFHRMVGVKDTKRKDIESGVWYYNDRTIKSWTYILSLIISGLLPATSMIVLYFLKDPAAILITICVYDMVFVLVMGLMVKARRVEIFAAATAFAAVQVTMITAGKSNT